jgi:hypothetical protein
MRKGVVVFPLAAGAAGVGLGLGREAWIVWAGIVCCVSAVGIWTGWVRWPRKAMGVVPIDGGEFRLLPRWTRLEQRWSPAVPLGAGAIASMGLVGYPILRGRALSLEERWLAVAGACCGIGLIVHAIRCATLARAGRQPSISLSTDGPRLDQSFRLRVEVEAADDQQDVHVTLRCMEHVLMHSGRYTHHVVRLKSEQIVEFRERIFVSASRMHAASADVVLDSRQHVASGSAGMSMYPYYHWEIEAKGGAGAKKGTIFPLTVAEPSVD